MQRVYKKIVYNSKSIVQKKYLYKSAVVYNGVDTKTFKPKKTKEQDRLNIIFVGRICEEKGLDYLFKAVKPINNEIKITVIGNGRIKHYKKKYPFVNFLGQLTHKEVLINLQNNDIFVLPSLKKSTESFSNALLEAMACEKAVIGTNVYGTPEMIKDNYNGLIIPERDPEAIKRAILKLKDIKLRQNLGKNARITALKKFKMEQQLEKLYQALFIT